MKIPRHSVFFAFLVFLMSGNAKLPAQDKTAAEKNLANVAIATGSARGGSSILTLNDGMTRLRIFK